MKILTFCMDKGTNLNLISELVSFSSEVLYCSYLSPQPSALSPEL